MRFWSYGRRETVRWELVTTELTEESRSCDWQRLSTWRSNSPLRRMSSLSEWKTLPTVAGCVEFPEQTNFRTPRADDRSDQDSDGHFSSSDGTVSFHCHPLAHGHSARIADHHYLAWELIRLLETSCPYSSDLRPFLNITSLRILTKTGILLKCCI